MTIIIIYQPPFMVFDPYSWKVVALCLLHCYVIRLHYKHILGITHQNFHFTNQPCILLKAEAFAVSKLQMYLNVTDSEMREQTP